VFAPVVALFAPGVVMMPPSVAVFAPMIKQREFNFHLDK